MSAALTDTEKRTYRIGDAVIDTYTKPSEWEFSLDDVWKVLEKLPRYLGGSSRTVAEHSLSVAEKASILAETAAKADGFTDMSCDIIASFAHTRGLWHDASEAFTGDIPGPMKRHLNPSLRDFEDALQEIVYKKANCDAESVIKCVGSKGLNIVRCAVSQADADDYREEQAAMKEPLKFDADFVADFKEGHSAEPPPAGAVSSAPPPEPPQPAAAAQLGSYDKYDLLMHHEDLCTEAWDLMHRKNNDYAGASGASPFKNFLHAETLGLCTVEQGMVVRLSDKLQRLSHFVSGQEMQVKDEALQDTILDIINYAVLISAYTKAKKDGAL